MRWRTGLLALAASAVMALLFGGAAQAAESVKPVCGLNDGKPATGEPIPIGSIVSITGPDNFSSSGFAAQAYFKCVNANGGIHGRPIKFLMEDDGWNPEQSSQVAAKLIRDEHVVALAGNMSFVDCGANQGIYEKEDVMVIAGVGVPRDCFFQKNYVTTNAGPRVSNTKAIMGVAQEFPGKIKRVVCIAPNIPNVGEWSCNGAVEWIKRQGGDGKVITFDPGCARRDLGHSAGDGVQAGRDQRRDAQGPRGAHLRRRRGAGPCGQSPHVGARFALQSRLPEGDRPLLGREGTRGYGAQVG